MAYSSEFDLSRHRNGLNHFQIGLGIAFYFIIIALAFAAVAQPVTPRDQNFEGLLFKTTEPGKFLPAPLLATEVKIDVTGPIARTNVRQYFINPTENWLEGIYIFPLPDKSAVDSLKMRIGERLIEGVIKEKKQARRIYDKARAQGKRAALLSSQRPNIFTTSVANIGPKQGIIIEFTYQEMLPFKDGRYTLRFPMVVGPRYHPPGSAKGMLAEFNSVSPDGGFDEDDVSPPVAPPGTAPINPVKLAVRIGGGIDGASLKSHHHAIKITTDSEERWIATLADGAVPADRDFELTWSPPANQTQATLFTEKWQGRNYGLVTVTPPVVSDPEVTSRRRDVIFVIDTSGSMAGRSIKQAKASLKYAISQLRLRDRFNIIRFSNSAHAMFNKVMPADRWNVQTAKSKVDGLTAEGGTNIRAALDLALADHEETSHLRQIIFITDGSVSNEAELFKMIANRLGDARLFTVGIGSAPNQHFMRGAAKQGRGIFTFIGSPSQVVERMKALWKKISSPVATDIFAVPSDPNGVEIWPNPLPDLFAGDPLHFAFRFPDGLNALELKGLLSSGPWSRNLSIAEAKPGIGIAKVWAREKILALRNSVYRGAAANIVDAEILKTALDHSLVTKMTSLVAVDKTPARDQDQPLHSNKMPTNLPFGWEYDKVFGPSGGAIMPQPIKAIMERSRARFQRAGIPLLKAAPRPPAGFAPARAPGKLLKLPQTATPGPLYLGLGFVIMLMGMALALTMGWVGWRRIG